MHERWGAGLGKGWGWPREDFVTLGLSCLSCKNVRPSPRDGPRKVWMEKFKSRWQVVVGEIHSHELLGFGDGEFGGGGRGMCGGLCGGTPQTPSDFELYQDNMEPFNQKSVRRSKLQDQPPHPPGSQLLSLLSRLCRVCEQF